MFHPRAHHCGRLGARTRAGLHATGYRCCLVVHGDDWRGVGSYLNQWLGVAVISLLGNHGIAPQRALLFSVCFGLVLAVGSLPGALIWLFYSFAPSSRAAQQGAW